MIVAIIGGGASGMAAAIEAAKNRETKVIVLERQGRVGRKLQATGNGRCNLSNIHADLEHYHGQQPEFAAAALKQYGVQETLKWFQNLGLYSVAEDSGKIYPYSDQANSVVDILRFALEQPNIQLLAGCEVTKIRREEKGFSIEATDHKIICDKLIIACGGLAGTKLGGTMAGYQLLRSMGHHVSHLRPALVQLKTSWNGVTGLKGIRSNCSLKILKDGMLFSESMGELQFTEYGISGPVVFEISRDVGYEKGTWVANLDFLPDLTEAELRDMLILRQGRGRLCEDLLTGIIHNRLGRVLVHSVGIADNVPISQLNDGDLQEICRALKHFELNLTGPMGMESAQVTAGGILTGEFQPDSMESILVPGLYACGEVLDIDGDCGGYNLQWAWSSGRLAGHCAGGYVE